MAECNYWGKSIPRPDKFYGEIYYEPYLGTNPLPTLPAPDDQPAPLPKTYALTGNVPNPFNPLTTIQYDVPAPGGQVRIRVFNVQGQLVQTVVSGVQTPGSHEVLWNGTDDRGGTVACGVYFLEMTATGFRATRKIMMLK